MKLTVHALAVLVFALPVACGDNAPSDATAASSSSDGGTVTGTGTGTGTETGTEAGGESSSSGGSVAGCGDPPYATVGGTLLAYPSNEPIVGAIVTSDSCPGVMATTDDQGYAALEVAIGEPYYPKVVADGFLTTRTGEQRPLADFDGGVALYANELAGALPHWSEASPTILVIVFSDPIAGAACDELSGYIFEVTGHPEAIITYYSGTTMPVPDETLTATGPLGIAEIAGLEATAGGPLIELSAQKPGCEVSFVSYPHTGKYVLEPGVLTVAGAFVPPISPPE